MAEREFIVKEWRDDKGILHIREVGQELVRCKECKHYALYWHFCTIDKDTPLLKHLDDFCSYGEREGE